MKYFILGALLLGYATLCTAQQLRFKGEPIDITTPAGKGYYDKIASRYNPRFPRPLSPKVATIYKKVIASALTHPSNSPTPATLMATSGKFVTQITDYGVNNSHCPKILVPLIEKAQEEVLIAHYLFDWQSRCGQQVIQAVIDLNKRLQGTGKKVRVWILISTVSMLDYGRHSWQTKWKKANFYTDLRELPPPAFAFPEPRLMRNLSLRIKTFHKFVFGAMHSKMAIIDGRHVVAGGKNLDALTGHEYMFRVDGTVHQPMRADFEEIWGEPLPALRSAITRPQKGDVPMIYVGRTEDPTFFANNEDNPQNLAWIGGFKVAKKEVFIESPNVVTQRITDLAVETVKRGVKVTIVTSLYMSDAGQMVYMNSYKTSPLMAKHVYDRLKDDPAAAKRMTICWFIGKKIKPAKPSKDEWTHVKAMTVDDEFAIVGSGNHDPQSWYHSREDNYLIDDAAVAKRIKANILAGEQSLQHCFHGAK